MSKVTGRIHLSNLIGLVLLCLVVSIVWWSGRTVPTELQAQQNFYCEMVNEGSWPDYKNTYEESCK